MTTLRKQILELKNRPTLENLRIMVLTEIVKEYGLRSSDIPLLTKVVEQVNSPILFDENNLNTGIEIIEDGKED